MTDLVNLLKTIGAPVLATAIGGPIGTLASAALGALADALGTDPTPDAVASKVAAGGEAAATIVRQVEADKAPGYLDELNAYLADVKDARQQTVKLTEAGSSIAWGAPVISVMIVMGFLGLVTALLFKTVPDNQVTLILFGGLSAAFSQVVSYWLGSSAGSARAGDTIRAIAQNASTPSAGQVVGKVVDAALRPGGKR